jgi:hypothetical protein
MEQFSLTLFSKGLGYAIDGAFSNNLPLYDSNTITISIHNALVCMHTIS